MGDILAEPIGEIGTQPVCCACGSKRIGRDAFACWNPETGLWELENTFDDLHCHECEASTSVRWERAEDAGRKAVRDLNDRFRRDGQGNGSVMITNGIQAEGEAFMHKAMYAVRTFNAFTADNDPWGERDFGAIEIDGQKVFWKIDCYDRDLKMGSPNPANEAVTHRVLTIMLASEY